MNKQTINVGDRVELVTRGGYAPLPESLAGRYADPFAIGNKGTVVFATERGAIVDLDGDWTNRNIDYNPMVGLPPGWAFTFDGLKKLEG